MGKLKGLFIALVLSLCVSLLSVAGFATEGKIAASSPSLTVARLVIAGSIVDREPVGIVNAFSSSTEKIYCFLEAKDIKEDTTVNFVWYHDDKKMATVELPVGKGSRWRTNSSKKLAGLKGEWKVELQDSGGNVLETVTFTVE
jgi:hypothetical protein